MQTFRRAIIPLALLVAIVVAAPRAWLFVSTIPADDPDAPEPAGLSRGLIPPLPFDSTVFTTSARVLRWGPDRGMLHGTFALTDSEGGLRVRGAFERGRKVGRWEILDATGATLERGVYRDDVRDGPWVVAVGQRRVEVEYVRGCVERWRIAIAGRTLPWAVLPDDCRGDFAIHVIRPGSRLPGSALALGLVRFQRSAVEATRRNSTPMDAILLEATPYEFGTWICIDAEGRLEGCGAMNRGTPTGWWTFFGTDGAITAQRLFDPHGAEVLVREAPPWQPLEDSFRAPGAWPARELRVTEGPPDTGVDDTRELLPGREPSIPDAAAPFGQG